MAATNPNQKKKDSSSYPDPFIIDSLGEHRQTFILLHGRGSTGEIFGKGLLASQLSGSTDGTLATTLPNMKFIFPTAKKRRAKWYNRASVHQWFDSVPIDEQDAGMSQTQVEWQLEGLRQSREFLGGIVEEEVERVGASNVFTGGLSQGCAMALHLLLSYEGSLGGFVGISGWLPFVEDMEELLRSGGKDVDLDEEDPFARSGSENDGEIVAFSQDEETNPRQHLTQSMVALEICNFVRDNMDLSPINSSEQPQCLRTPILLGHGRHDGKVKIEKGLRAAELLRDIGMQVVWKEYDEGHWYKVPNQIDDLAVFLREHTVALKQY